MAFMTTQELVAAAAKGARNDGDRRFILKTWAKAADAMSEVSVIGFL
jgi:hypothetical protein